MPKICGESLASGAKSMLRDCLMPFAACAITPQCPGHSGPCSIQFTGTQRESVSAGIKLDFQPSYKRAVQLDLTKHIICSVGKKTILFWSL